MKVTKRTIYEAEINGENFTLEFIKSTATPSFSHKIIIAKDKNLVAKDWLGSHVNPTQKTAIFFFEKHLTKKLNN